MNERYILGEDGKTPVPAKTLEWKRWFEKVERNVAQDQVGQALVSTDFVGLNHQFVDGGRPLLFETVVFGGPLDGEQARYSTWDEAANGHQEMLRRVLAVQ